MQPFRLLKKSELDRLQARATAAAAAWAGSWQSSAVPEWTTIEPSAPDEARCIAVQRLAVGEGDYACLAIGAGAIASIADALFGASDPSRPRASANPISAAFAVRAALDCAAHVVAQAAGAATWISVDAVDVDALRRGSGAACLEARICGAPVARLFISLGMLRRLDTLTAAAPRVQDKCVARAEAVLGAQVPVTVDLADTAMTIKELRGLAVGDVLLLAQSLDSPFFVRVGRSKAGRAHLGRSSNRYAVELVRQPK